MRDHFRKILNILVEWFRPNIENYLKTRQPVIWLFSLFIGLAVGIGAILFREAIALVQLSWLGTTSETFSYYIRELPWYMVVLAPATAGLVVGIMLDRFVPQRRASSVADVIETRVIGSDDIPMKQAATSAIVTAVSLGGGASAGREGPVVHLGAAIAANMTRFLGLPEWGRRTFLACGVAAAVSASFNAPIAGVLFAHEVILSHYAMRAFVPIVISSVAATLLSRQWFGDVAAFTIPHYQIASYWEFPAFFILGLVCALVSVLFQASVIITDYAARKVTMPLILRPVIGGLAIGAIALVYPQVLGVGYEATDAALNRQLSLDMMLGLLVAKTAATAITIASRFGGGIFSPSLYLGAMAGGAFGLIAAKAFPEFASSEALYAIVGMGAVAAAVLGAPISTTMIVFELTGGYALTIALLLCVSIANGINNAVHGHSIFQWQLEMRGIFITDGQHRHLIHATRVRDFMDDLDGDEEMPDLDEDKMVTLLPSQDLEEALRAFDTTGLHRLPVVDRRENGRLVGWASQVRALSYFNRALVDATSEEHLH